MNFKKPSMIQRIRSRNPSAINEQDNVSTAGSVTSNMAAEIVRNSAKPILRSLTVKKRNPENIENQVTDEDAEQPSFSGTYISFSFILHYFHMGYATKIETGKGLNSILVACPT